VNPEFNILFNPEFLVEATFMEDFLDQDRIVLGGKETRNLERLYRLGWPNARYYHMNATSAELVKYGANAFLAAKVSFFNEIYFLAKALGIEYTTIARAICADHRIGDWGSIVPGPDGQHGWGGKCFPKDLVTLLDLQNELCVPNSVCRGTWLTNEHVREVQDWHNITGATTEKAYGSDDLDE
jgi:UDPglucose 6-dehydrogenase